MFWRAEGLPAAIINVIMDDRIEWMKLKLEEGLPILKNSAIFEEFITREDGNNESILESFLNNKTDERGVMFYSEEKEEEEEIEVEIGRSMLKVSNLVKGGKK